MDGPTGQTHFEECSLHAFTLEIPGFFDDEYVSGTLDNLDSDGCCGDLMSISILCNGGQQILADLFRLPLGDFPNLP